MRLRWLGLGAASCIAFAACGRSGVSGLDRNHPENPGHLRVLSVTAGTPQWRPGGFGYPLQIVVQNQGTAAVHSLAGGLSFRDDFLDRDWEFDWRERDFREGVGGGNPTTFPPTDLAPAGVATILLTVDADPLASDLLPVTVRGNVWYSLSTSGAPVYGAGETIAPLVWDVTPVNASLVVDTASDFVDGVEPLSLREALAAANAAPGIDRITFDRKVFPPGEETPIVVLSPLGTLGDGATPEILDASGTGATLVLDSSLDSSSTFGLAVNGPVTVRGVRFRDFSRTIPPSTTISPNCNPAVNYPAGGIELQGNGAVLVENDFSDPLTSQRTCFGLVHVTGGQHRIVRNLFHGIAADAILLQGGSADVSDNQIIAATPEEIARSTEGIVALSQGNQNLYAMGNLIVGLTYSGIVGNAAGDGGALVAFHNTIVRTGVAGIRRTGGGGRTFILVNNVYLDNKVLGLPTYGALFTGNDGAANVNAAVEVTGNEPYCLPSCTSINASAIVTTGSNLVVDSAGTTAEAFTPLPGSLLLDHAAGLLDRNGEGRGRWEGAGPDIGAVERP